MLSYIYFLIQMVDNILSDSSMERMDRIERLESILAAASIHALNPSPTSHAPSNKVDAETQVDTELLPT